MLGLSGPKSLCGTAQLCVAAYKEGVPRCSRHLRGVKTGPWLNLVTLWSITSFLSGLSNCIERSLGMEIFKTSSAYGPGSGKTFSNTRSKISCTSSTVRKSEILCLLYRVYLLFIKNRKQIFNKKVQNLQKVGCSFTGFAVHSPFFHFGKWSLNSGSSAEVVACGRFVFSWKCRSARYSLGRKKNKMLNKIESTLYTFQKIFRKWWFILALFIT